ncbi:MAG: inositol monophosphatase [Oscillospiraceae bacterium]|nr:inositol monophosphatase [Oscillospiraceae bacterium]
MCIDINLLKELVYRTKDIITDKMLIKSVNEKGFADFVTAVDTGVQNMLEHELAALYPDIQFMGEEGEHHKIDPSGKVWILDPIDGTTNLIYDYKMSAVSLALYAGGDIIAGIVYNPFTNEMFTAEKGKGAYLNGERIHVSSADTISKSMISIGTSPYEKERADRNFDIFKNIFKASLDIRRSGSAALDLCYVASGRTDGYMEQNLKPWDFAAGMLILSEAGGMITDYNTNPVNPLKNSDVLASNGLIHQELTEFWK